MNFIELFKEQFYFIGCDISREISEITVLDFDTLYSYKTFCKNVPDFESYFTVKTKKGYHVYCLYNPELKSCNNVLRKLIHVITLQLIK